MMEGARRRRGGGMETVDQSSGGDADGIGKHGDKKVMNVLVGSIFALLAGFFFFTSLRENVVSLTRQILRTSVDPETGLITEHMTVEHVFDLNIHYSVALYMSIAALGHFVLCIPIVFKRYTSFIERGMGPHRWIEYSFSASLMMVVIGVSVGIRDIAALVQMAVCMSTCMLFGWLAEEGIATQHPLGLRAHVFAWLPFVAAWTTIAHAVWCLPADVLAASTVPMTVAAIFAGFCAFGVAQSAHLFGFVSNEAIERTFVVLSLWDKAFLATCVAFGLLSA